MRLVEDGSIDLGSDGDHFLSYSVRLCASDCGLLFDNLMCDSDFSLGPHDQRQSFIIELVKVINALLLTQRPERLL